MENEFLTKQHVFIILTSQDGHQSSRQQRKLHVGSSLGVVYMSSFDACTNWNPHS